MQSNAELLKSKLIDFSGLTWVTVRRIVQWITQIKMANQEKKNPARQKIKFFSWYLQQLGKDRFVTVPNPCRKLLATLEITPDDGKIIFCLRTSAYPSAQPLKIRHITDKCHYNSLSLPPPLPFPWPYPLVHFHAWWTAVTSREIIFIYATQHGLLSEGTHLFHGHL